VSLEFDGVSMNATVYLNGKKLGFHPYAYSSFRYDLTSHLKLSQKNVLSVRVDNALQPNSRWYSGSGIYRHVRLIVTDPTHVAPWGVFISTPSVSSSSAKVLIKTEIQVASSDLTGVTLTTQLFDAAGKKLSASSVKLPQSENGLAETTEEMVIAHPSLWSAATPHLYRAVTQINRGGKVIDQVETNFGVRTLAWSVDKGFLLNGNSLKFAGGSVHHDNGPLGAAAFDRAEVRKVELLKAAGFNAVRTAHSTPSPAFLDACDRLGLMVIDEPFDVWKVAKVKYDYAQYFDEWWQQDLDAMVKRDRNHPSIVVWGIGNEIPDAFTPEGAPIATKLAARVRELDPSRPLTEAFPGATYTPPVDAVFAQVDIGGYNYNIIQNQAADHKRVPSRIMMTTESFAADAFEQWQMTQTHPYIVGEFVWTAMDYLGESGIGAWSYVTAKQETQLAGLKKMLPAILSHIGADGKNPAAAMYNGQTSNPLFPGFPWHAAYSGDIDLTGFRKPQSYYRDILWNGGDRIFTTVRLPAPEGMKISAPGWGVYPSLPNWTWPGQESKPMTVDVYSGAEKVRLYLNDSLIGEQPTGKGEAFMATFTVPYSPGTLKAVGLRGERVVAEQTISTVSAPVRLKITPDRSLLNADGQDLAFVVIEAVDASGKLTQNADQRIEVAVSGAASLAAIGNGDGKSLDSYAGTTCTLYNGRALVILRTTSKAGSIQITANASGLASASALLKSSPGMVGPQLR
jgi:beta-galactosidase